MATCTEGASSKTHVVSLKMAMLVCSPLVWIWYSSFSSPGLSKQVSAVFKIKLEDRDFPLLFFSIKRDSCAWSCLHCHCTTGWQSICHMGLDYGLHCKASPNHTPDMAMQHVLTLQETPKVQRTVDCTTAAQPSIS